MDAFSLNRKNEKIGEKTMKFSKTNLARIFVLMVLVVGIGYATASIGRFTPTHAIKEPVYCGSCHPDQVQELNATTHLPHFMGAIVEEAEAVSAPNTAGITLAESVSGGCMMCHNTWNIRDQIFVNGYELNTNVDGTGNYQLKLNDVVLSATNKSTRYDVAVKLAGGNQFIRLGSDIVQTGKNMPKVTVQDPGTSGVVIGTALNSTAGEFSINATGVTLLDAGNVTALNASGDSAVKITYQLTSNQTRSLKEMWGELSALSPTQGVFYNDQEGRNTCGNSEKGFCHAVETVAGLNVANKLPENKLGVYGSGIYFQHEMAYTSAEYQAKQVKLCGACHFNKLPPMDADGNPKRQDVTDIPQVYRSSHGVIYQTNITTISSDWAHKQVQCIRCHGHAGIGTEDAPTGVRSN